MSSCDNNASESNNITTITSTTSTTTTILNEEYKNDQETLTATKTTATPTTATATPTTIIENNENLSITKTNENPISNIDNTSVSTTATTTAAASPKAIATATTTTTPTAGEHESKVMEMAAFLPSNILLQHSADASTIQTSTTTPPATSCCNSSAATTSAVDDKNATCPTTTIAATSELSEPKLAGATFEKSAAFTILHHQGHLLSSDTAAETSTVTLPADKKATTTVALEAVETTATSASTLPSAATTVAIATPTQTSPSPTTTTTSGRPPTIGPHLPHIASEPTFGIILRRNQQQQQQQLQQHHHSQHEQQQAYRSSHHAKGVETSSTSISSIDDIATTSSGIRSGSISASASPSMARKSSDALVSSMPRRVSFPKSDNELVTGYLEPANPWVHARLVKSISEIAELYVMSCKKHNTKPLQNILDHLKVVELNKTLRQPLLSLKSIKLAPSDCEALEEVFKRVQYKAVDLSSCELNEMAASAIFDMIEYYEAANELDISSNADGMTHRGWTSCSYMVSKCRALQVLNAQGNPISRSGAESLGNALSTSNLHTLKLEHCGLKGTPLSGLCFKLRYNRILRELWLAHNDLDSDDADSIATLLITNHYLQLVDISNNNIQDEGLAKIVKALQIQSEELEKRSSLQRTAAIDDDDVSSSPVDTTSVPEFSTNDAVASSNNINSTNGQRDDDANIICGLLDSDASQSEDTDDDAFEAAKKISDIKESSSCMAATATETTSVGGSATTTATTTASEATPMAVSTTSSASITTANTSATDDLDADEDTEDTVKSSNTLKNSTQSAGGQSMLDKLLSMNSTDSSSDDGASNLSTDTIAACCSEDASLISDEIFDGTATATTNTSTNSNAAAARTQSPTSTSVANESISSPATAFLLEKVTQQQMLESKNFLVGTMNNDPSSESVANGESNTESNSSSSGNSSAASASLASNHNNNNNNNNNNATTNINSSLQSSGVFEVTAVETDCLISASAEDRLAEHHALLLQHSTKALDVNKNTKLVDDFDDTHSTDSAFESASEGDISRHLPDEFSRLSTSFESTRIDETTKELAIETATIATESTECLLEAAATPSSTPTPTPPPPIAPLVKLASQMCEATRSRSTLTSPPPPTTAPTLAASVVVTAISPVVAKVVEEEKPTAEVRVTEGPISYKENSPPLPLPPKVTIAEDSLITNKVKLSNTSPSPTPPPPSTSPGGVSLGMRRTESSCAFITSSTRNRSQSSDSLCSDNSLDGSISSDINFSTSTQINEKLTKNDTLTRQQRQFEAPVESTNKVPCGLKALALWNNNLTKESGRHIADLLAKTNSLELLNIGKNCLSNDFVTSVKDSLMKNTTLTTLGLQSAHLSAKGIETLSSILTFGGNCTLQRIDIRDNKLEVESLSTLGEVLKSNTTVTQIDIDDEPKRLSVANDAHLDYARVLENVRSMCSRNEKTQSQMQAADKSTALANVGRRRGGYYLGSRKISLTCHTRPVVVMDNNAAVVSVNTTAKLDVKRKSGTRLRSPIPSPPTVSPSSSPSRSRFKVIRVSEVSPLTSPMSSTPPPSLATTTSSSVAIPTLSTSSNSSSFQCKIQSTSLPTSMATITTSSTQSIKRHSVSPRSRFQVSKIYEDPRVPLAKRALPPITPPLNAPPTPMSKSSNPSFSPPVLKTDSQTDAIQTASLTPAPGLQPPPAAAATTITTTDLSHTPNVDSTNITRTTNTNENSTPSTQLNKTTLSPISSASPSSSSSSSSSSTSPASTSSSSSITSGGSSSSPSSSNPLFNDHIDSGAEHRDEEEEVVVSMTRCPIAIFDENEITLTKNSINNVLSNPSASVPASSDAAPSSDTSVVGAAEAAAVTTVQQQQQPVQQRARKTSWLGNPAAVDKLLTLFHNPGTIFQRSASPEPNFTSSSAAAVGQSNNTTGTCLPQQQQQQQPKSLVSTRKCSPPSWSKLGNEMMRPMTNALQQNTASCGNDGNATTVGTLATTAALEQSISFLDAASKQICDFSKQVFRQNLSFGNESNSPGATAGMANIFASGNGGGGGASIGGNGLSEQHDAAYIPSDVKLEIKENISPEHTITDETLQSLQKLCSASCVAAAASSGAALVEDPVVVNVQNIEERINQVEDNSEPLGSNISSGPLNNSAALVAMPTASTNNNSSLQHEEPTTQTS